MRTAFNFTGKEAVFSNVGLKKKVNILLIGDPHLNLADERDNAYSGNYKRMKDCSGDIPVPRFMKVLEQAKTADCDLLAIAGDLISFPTLANVDFALNALQQCGLPWIYTAGNHDWHFEGLSGTEMSLRREWIQKRLLPFYQGKDPFFNVTELNGLRIVAIDNSLYEILPEQLEKLREVDAEGIPFMILCHVPMFVPGHNVFYGCGNPAWNAANDPYWEIERRPRWPENGPSQTTLEFHKAVFSAKNLIGILAGHTHRTSVDCWQEKIQIVTEAAFSGILKISVS